MLEEIIAPWRCGATGLGAEDRIIQRAPPETATMPANNASSLFCEAVPIHMRGCRTIATASAARVTRIDRGTAACVLRRY
jgi:hypothetical protein